MLILNWAPSLGSLAWLGVLTVAVALLWARVDRLAADYAHMSEQLDRIADHVAAVRDQLGGVARAQQIEELRRNVQVVNCSNCGAPVDLTNGSSCAHCGSPLSMLDLKQASALVHELREAEQAPRVDPTVPLQLKEARREVEAAFSGFERRPGWFDDVSRSGIVNASLSSLATWLKQQR